MIQIPQELLDTLSPVPGFERASFESSHAQGEISTVIRVNRAKISKLVSPGQDPNLAIAMALRENNPVPWCPGGYYLSRRPSFTLDPLFHAGLYYVQEPSSLFLDCILKGAADISKPLKVLDLCGAPGGKSTLLQSALLPDSLVVANEVIRTRVSILEASLIRWGSLNTIVTQNDPKDFSSLEGFFDVILVDAPCSGSGLFRKDPTAIEGWSPELVKLCSRRQQRILADVLPALKTNGILIYSTCSYSPPENEEIVQWLMEEFQMDPVDIPVSPEWHIITDMGKFKRVKGYRFYPYLLRGEGFFAACLKKTKQVEQYVTRYPKSIVKGKPIPAPLKAWLSDGIKIEIISRKENLLAFPVSGLQDYFTIDKFLKVKQAGVNLGKLIREEFIPDPAFALSTLYNQDLPILDLNISNAIKYLYKEPLDIDLPRKGWVLVKYNGASLGWAKILSRRVNNYYPSQWRILKERE